MILLDAYALVAFLAGGRSQAEVERLVRGGDSGVATANVAEAMDVSERVYGLTIDRSRGLLDPLFGSLIAVCDLDLRIAQRAAQLRAAHYRRRDRPISLADCVLLATAGADDRIATPDPDILAVARRERIGTLKLPRG